MSEYKVKNVKSFLGREGYGFNANLYCDNKKVAFIYDDASGAGVFFEWIDSKSENVEIIRTNNNQQKVSFNGSPLQADYYGYLEDQKETEDLAKCEYGISNFDDEIFANNLVNDFEELKQFKGWCRKKTVFRIKGDKSGEWRTVNNPFNIRVKMWIEENYGNKVEEILNERFKVA